MNETHEPTQPDFADATSVARWFGEEILSAHGIMSRSRTDAKTRLRGIAQALDTWSKLYRLASDTSELAALKSELETLRSEFDSQRGLSRIK